MTKVKPKPQSQTTEKTKANRRSRPTSKPSKLTKKSQLITVFAKNEKSNLSKAELVAAVELSKKIVAAYGGAK